MILEIAMSLIAAVLLVEGVRAGLATRRHWDFKLAPDIDTMWRGRPAEPTGAASTRQSDRPGSLEVREMADPMTDGEPKARRADAS